MAAPRAFALVLCSCGWRFGDSRRLEDEDRLEFELAVVRGIVPMMIRHWELKHEINVAPGAPLAVKAVIAKAAEQMARDEAPTTDEKGLVRQ